MSESVDRECVCVCVCVCAIVSRVCVCMWRRLYDGFVERAVCTAVSSLCGGAQEAGAARLAMASNFVQRVYMGGDMRGVRLRALAFLLSPPRP